MSSLYTYAATIRTVHDGDTLSVDLSLGRQLWQLDAKHRLFGCNARELTMPGGIEARDNLMSLLPIGLIVVLRSIKPYKFGAEGGEYMCAITLPGGDDLVTKLIADSWAIAWNGQGPKPVPPWPRPVAP